MSSKPRALNLWCIPPACLRASNATLASTVDPSKAFLTKKLPWAPSLELHKSMTHFACPPARQQCKKTGTSWSFHWAFRQRTHYELQVTSLSTSQLSIPLGPLRQSKRAASLQARFSDLRAMHLASREQATTTRPRAAMLSIPGRCKTRSHDPQNVDLL